MLHLRPGRILIGLCGVLVVTFLGYKSRARERHHSGLYLPARNPRSSNHEGIPRGCSGLGPGHTGLQLFLSRLIFRHANQIHLCERLKQLGFSRQSHIRLYGSQFELGGDPLVISEDVVLVDAVERKSAESNGRNFDADHQCSRPNLAQNASFA